ncbi:ABC transporter permease [Sporosarcina sp. Te-1]|uniref:ABC transporter permease n=1 Tax=Sporosarcina sp. Te-1 TaxID=2818390 RepID=UPI001A9FA1E2|nr:ABC transporter permease [Sporosarcina sp. Te-1]QTD40321.1 ABC transporter permease [Sporosarcina sp. Te-1]
MFNLVRLELKKESFKWYFIGAIIANVLILALVIPIQYVEKIETDEMFMITGALVRAVFMIFGAVLLSKLIIEEYKNKTIFLMYTYPIQRKKLIAAKLLLAGSLTFITIAISSAIVATVYFIIHNMFQLSPNVIPVQRLSIEILSMFKFAIAAAGASLIPLYFGLRRQSVPATLLSSLLVVTIISQSNPWFSLADNIYISLAFAVIGVFIAFWTIRNVDKVDAI